MESNPLNDDGGGSEEGNANNDDNNRSSSPDKLLPETPPPPDLPLDSPPPDNDMDQSKEKPTETDQSEPGTETGQSEPPNENADGDLKPDSAGRSSSPRVQFGAGTKERDGSRKGVQRVKRSFKDIVLTEVMKADPQEMTSVTGVGGGGGGGAPPKGILKVRSEPALSGSDSEKSYVNKGYEDDEDAHSRGGGGGISATSRSAFPFFKRSGSDASDGHGFADVVDLLIQRTSIDFGGRDVHPFGRDCSLEGIMQTSRPKSHSKNSAFSKLMIWITLMSFLLGAAFGVILLSETYNAKQRTDKQLKASLNLSNTGPAL